jgi:CDP-glucose 4,6-dehydratase
MEMMNFEIYKGKKVFLTGHTGFKGSWMAYWLKMLGAEVYGYSLAPNTEPNHHSLLSLDFQSQYANICNLDILSKAIKNFQPDIIFHLAAQPLVRYSYKNPIETYQTNVIGTVNIMEAARGVESIKGIVIITTDKCYENVEQTKGYVETDRMGGYDPYSSSKGCAELAVNSYRNSFFNLNEYQKNHQTLIASARAGNVIGGGDWSEDRLIPDIIRSAIKGEKTLIRYPKATRPWQHVLEPISGYLMLGERLLNGDKEFAEGWNFGPQENDVLTVGEVLAICKKNWDKIQFQIDTENKHFHEAGLLSLNIEKAKTKLGWKPRWSNEQSILNTINWYRNYYDLGVIDTDMQIKEFNL